MNFVDMVLETSKEQQQKTNFVDFVTAPVEDNQFLSDNAQGFADDVSADLGLPKGSVKTTKDWKSLNEAEEAKLKQENEQATLSDVVSSAIKGEPVENSKDKLMSLAKKSVEGIPYAAAISANKQAFAESDITNEENLMTPAEISLKMQRAVGKNRVLKQAAVEAREEAKKSSMGHWGKYVTFGSAPGLEALNASKAIKALGIETEQIFQGDYKEDAVRFMKAFDASTPNKVFEGFLAYVQSRDDVSEEDFSQVVKKVKEIWNENGVNLYEQAELLEQAANYSPGLPTFNAFALIPTGLNTAEFGGKAVAGAVQGLPLYAAKNAALGTLEVASVPFAGKVVDVAFKPINRAVRAFTPSSEIAKTMDKAIKTNNREVIKETAEALLGAPTNKEYLVKSERVDGTFRYFIDPVVDTVDNAEKSLANSPAALGLKIKQAFAKRLEASIETLGETKRLTDDYIRKLAVRVTDSLDLNNLVAAGRGTYGEKIVAFTDLDNTLRSKEGSLVYAVKLVRDNDPVSAFQSVLKTDSKGKTYDLGKRNAEKLGESLAAAANASETEETVSFTTDFVRLSQENGYWRPTLLVNTHKGIGTIHYEAFKEAGKMKQEQYRPLLSSVATVTSNPSHIRSLNISAEIEKSLIKSTGDAATESFKALPKKERQGVQALVDLSTQYGAWYEPEVLLAKGFSEDGVKAYMQFKLMNDLDEFVRNTAMRRDLVSKGGKKVWFNGTEIDGVVRPIPELHTFEAFREKITGKRLLIDSISGTPRAVSDEGKLKDLFNRGYILIEPSISPDSTVAAKTFYYLLNPSSTTINDLGAFVTTYVAGGRRYFRKGAKYAKQLVMMTDEETGKRSIIGSQTFFTDLDGPGLARSVDVIERARKLWIKGDKEACTNLLQSQGWQKAPFNDADSFYEYMSGLGMDFENIDNTLAIVEDGRVLDTYGILSKRADVEDLVGLENMREFAKNARFQALTNEAKVQRMKRTGRELLTWDMERAQTVDFETQMRYLVNDMVENDVMGDYTDYVADHFASTFKDVMEEAPGGIQLTPRELLINGNVKSGLTGADAKKAKQAITAQKNFALMRNIPSDMDREFANKFTGLIEWVGGKVADTFLDPVSSVRHGVRVKWEEFKDTARPLHFLRTCVAHKMMGFFNVGQFLRQASQDVSIALMDNLAVTCAVDALRVETILLRSAGDRVKAIEFAKEAFKNDTELLNNALNIIDMGLFTHGTAGGFVEAGQTVKGFFNKLSFMPMNAGEMHPRVLSGLTALKRKGLYGVRKTPSELQEAALYSRSLFMNMDNSGLSRLQASEVASTILQFQTPTFRWMETVLFDKELTGWQRAKLGIGTALLVGGEGLIGIEGYTKISNNVYRIFHDDRTDEMPAYQESSKIMDAVRRGIVRAYLSDYTAGMDVVAPIEPSIDQSVDIFTGVLNFDFDQIASARFIGDLFKGGNELVTIGKKVFRNTATDEDYAAFLERFPRYAPSAWSKPWMAYNVYKTGEVLNTKGELQERTNSLAQAVLSSLGFNRLSTREIVKAYTENNYRAGLRKNFEDELYKTMLNWARHKSPESYAEVQLVLDAVNLYPREKAESFNKVWKRLPDAFRENISVLQLKQYMNGGISGKNLIEQ